MLAMSTMDYNSGKDDLFGDISASNYVSENYTMQAQMKNFSLLLNMSSDFLSLLTPFSRVQHFL